MQFTFLDMAGQTLFIRDDAESASWAVEEKSLSLDFPYVADKIVDIGQRVFFRDPSTNDPQIYEVKTVKTLQPDGVQQITAEHICISELTDEHMARQELTDVTCSAALAGVLTGTLWQVGNVSTNPSASANLDRGSVWQAVLNIQTNWNVYIVPRVTLSNDGTVARYLDIQSTDGVWNGIRLSIDKNLLDPSVTYDDSELVTALYGYGGTMPTTVATADPVECTFADVVWTANADHPAKPAGQTYIEDPAATAAYGRNGRKRFGFYQNTDVTDPETLLELTWQTLKKSSTPTISIEGSIVDLYRLGYADQPIRLHDIALVEVLPAGFKKQIQIIRLDVDLLDPSSTQVTIGDYIPNIVYINRDTSENVTGTRGGSGNKNTTILERHEFETAVESIDNGTGLRFRAFQNDLDDMDNELKLQEGRITVTYNKVEQEVVDRRNADGVLSGRITVEANRITQEVTRATGAESALNGRITVEAGKITQIVEAVGENGEVTAASIVLAINESGESVAHIDANKVYIGNDKSTTVIAGKCELSDVTAQYIAGKIATLSVLNVAAISATGNISTSNGYIMAPYYYMGTSGSAVNMASAVRLMQIVQSGNTYTLQKQDFDDTEWVDVGSFSRATTLTGAWSGGRFTASASPQGNTFWTELVQGTSSRDGGTITIPVEAIDQDSGGTQYATGRNVYVTLNTMSITRVPAYKNSGGSYEYYGKLYYYDASSSVYRAASDSDHYWYYSNKNRSGTNTVLYD